MASAERRPSSCSTTPGRAAGRCSIAAPREIVETRDPGEVRACLERLRGRHAAGFLAYEAGHALEDEAGAAARAAGRTSRPCSGSACSTRREEVDADALAARSGRRLGRARRGR